MYIWTAALRVTKLEWETLTKSNKTNGKVVFIYYE